MGGQIHHVRLMSDQALGEVEAPFDLLYVDGAHRYAPARADIERLGRPDQAGRHAAGARFLHAVGVMLAQLRLLFGSSAAGATSGAGAGWPSTRREDPAGGRAARAPRRRAQLGELPWFVRNLLVKALLVAARQRWAGRLGLGLAGTMAVLSAQRALSAAPRGHRDPVPGDWSTA